MNSKLYCILLIPAFVFCACGNSDQQINDTNVENSLDSVEIYPSNGEEHIDYEYNTLQVGFYFGLKEGRSYVDIYSSDYIDSDEEIKMRVRNETNIDSTLEHIQINNYHIEIRTELDKTTQYIDTIRAPYRSNVEIIKLRVIKDWERTITVADSTNTVLLSKKLDKSLCIDKPINGYKDNDEELTPDDFFFDNDIVYAHTYEYVSHNKLYVIFDYFYDVSYGEIGYGFTYVLDLTDLSETLEVNSICSRCEGA